MEREQEEAQYLDLFGVIRESISIVASWGTIFSKITFFHILPLSIIFLSHLWISQWLFGEILYDEDRLLFTRVVTPTYNDLRDLILNEEVLFFLFTILYYIFVIIFSLVSTSAVVYTTACIYTGKDLTFKKLINEGGAKSLAEAHGYFHMEFFYCFCIQYDVMLGLRFFGCNKWNY